MSALNRIIGLLRTRGHRPRPTRSGWSACCPAHDDPQPSLSIGEGRDGRVLLKCFAGCRTEDVLQELGLRWGQLWDRGCVTCDRPPGNAFPGRIRPGVTRHTSLHSPKRPRRTHGSPDEVIAWYSRQLGPVSRTWEYHDEEGCIVGLTARWDQPGGGKEVRPVALNGYGRWVAGAMPVPRPLFGLDQLTRRMADPVYVVEGEPAVEVALACGLLATTSPGGSRGASHADWSPMAGRDVVIVPDLDEPGSLYAHEVSQLARQAGALSVKILDLSIAWFQLGKGADLADAWELVGGDADAVLDGLGYLEGLQ